MLSRSLAISISHSYVASTPPNGTRTRQSGGGLCASALSLFLARSSRSRMLTRRHGGFRLGRKLLSVWRWALCHRRRRRGGYLRLQPSCHGAGRRSDSIRSPLLASPAVFADDKKHQFVVHRDDDAASSPRMLTWGRSLAQRMRLLRRNRKDRLLEDAAAEATTPKGQVAVYVGGGEPGTESMRYVVPVVYFNHPLFGELLREAEEEFGFEHPGGITIPCAASRFERAAAVAAAQVPGWW